MCFLLFANGLASFLWHALRAEWALVIDVSTGLTFLLALFTLSPLRVMRPLRAILFTLAFILTYLVIETFSANDTVPYGRWLSMLPSVVLFGGYLSYRSGLISRRAGYLGSIGIVSTALAISFRIYDSLAVQAETCEALPLGTHFLWHIFLSAAALLGISAMLLVVRSKAIKTQT